MVHTCKELRVIRNKVAIYKSRIFGRFEFLPDRVTQDLERFKTSVSFL